MEGLGWWIYLCSVAGGILAISLTIFIVCLVQCGHYEDCLEAGLQAALRLM